MTKDNLLTQINKKFKHKIMFLKVLSRGLEEISLKEKAFCQYLCLLMLLVTTQIYQDCVIRMDMVHYFCKRQQK